MDMDWYEFFIHPMNYVPPEIDAWLTEWKNWLDLFVQTNPWFCIFLSSTGMVWLTWFVMHTPWKWDDKLPDWIGKHIFKKENKLEKAIVASEEKREVHLLVDEVK